MFTALTCPYCRYSKRILTEKIPPDASRATCPQCGKSFELRLDDIIRPEPGVAAPGPAAKESDCNFEQESGAEGNQRTVAPWENRSEVGFLRSIIQTVRAVLFSPQSFFGSLPFREGIGEPLAFGLLIGSTGSLFGFFWQILVASGGLFPVLDPLFAQFAVGLIFLVIIVAIPIVVTLGMFLYSSILHLCLLMVGGGKNGYEATFRVVSYSQSAQILGIIPFLGGVIAGVWQLVVQVIGLREIHETSFLRIMIAFFIPLALLVLMVISCFGLIFLAFFNQNTFF
jgi:hypothetical protein